MRTCSEVVDGGGDGPARVARPRGRRTGERDERSRRTGLFLLLGAEPHCDWLPPAVARDERGFVLTGRDVPDASAGPTACRRRTSPPPCPASSPPATSASGSMKRVAAASGEGASVVPLVHAYLAPAPD